MFRTERQFEMNPHSANRKERAKERKKQQRELLDFHKGRLDEFSTAKSVNELSFPAILNKDQRRELHKYSMHCGLNPTYRNSGNFSINIPTNIF